MTKQEALNLYNRAFILGEGWEQAAHALAAALQPAKAAKPKRNTQQGRNTRQGLKSLSGLAPRLPQVRRQKCGHDFNSSGCAVCPECARRPARFIEDYKPRIRIAV